MIILLTIFQYLIQAVVDLMDKFLITARKLEPVKYTFYTVVTGLVLLLIWPWNYFSLPAHLIFLGLLSGAVFSLAIYVFFRALAQGEVSRVVPFVFGLVPVFDILISIATGRDTLRLNEVAAMFLLIPGALLVSHQKSGGWGKHAALKTLAAFLMSCYYALWQYAAQKGPVLNNLMWNRLGAALVLFILLILPGFRTKVFSVDEIKNKAGTSVMFLFKQLLGGLNFVFFSFLLVLGKISVINGLQGFRYIFLLFFSLFLSKKRRHMIAEDDDSRTFTQKSFGIILIFIGTILLFV
jgi:uncharacterized membrane protein